MKIKLCVIVLLLMISSDVFAVRQETRIAGGTWIKKGDNYLWKATMKRCSSIEKLTLIEQANACYLKALLERTEGLAKEDWIIVEEKDRVK
jgi:hypothetical protein